MLFLTSLLVFFSSFLLFSIEPMIGKGLLPLYGGISIVWIILVSIFMAILFLGYWYALLIAKLPSKRQFLIHAAVLIGSGLLLPIQSFGWYRFIPALFALSATTTLMQSWTAKWNTKKSPYPLFAFSNAGSLIGLLSYPFLIEPNLILSRQTNIWMVLFILFALSMLGAVRSFNSKTGKPQENPQAGIKFFSKTGFVWLALSFIANFSVLATTSQVTQSLAPAPLLWVIPLSLYLLSFVVAFSGIRWYQREFHIGLLIFMTAVTVAVTTGTLGIGFLPGLFVTYFTMFLGLLIVNTELYLSRPAHSKDIPLFYLAISLGGVIAGVVLGFIAPNIFPDLWEYPLSLFLVVLTATLILIKKSSPWIQKAQFGLLIIVTGVFIFRSFIFYFGPQFGPNHVLERVRNYYGTNKVVEAKNQNGSIERWLINGTINHGMQTVGSSEPTLYYAPNTGVDYAIEKNLKRVEGKPITVGLIGLGAGTLAEYCKSGDVFRFYEINPQVVELAKKYFTFISDCEESGGKVEVVTGDGRLSLQKELNGGKEKQFDVLVIDAFSGDSVPTHLLTKEAIDLYFRQVTDGGILAFDVSNKYLNLSAVLSADIQGEGVYSSYFEGPTATWLLMTKRPVEGINWGIPPDNSQIKPWTDQFSNLYEILLH